MSDLKSMDDHGWKGGLVFAKTIGQVKLAKTAIVYAGRWVDLVDFHPRHKQVEVYISPAPRYFSWDEVEAFKFTPDQMQALLDKTPA